jgi:hypothetical protein
MVAELRVGTCAAGWGHQVRLHLSRTAGSLFTAPLLRRGTNPLQWLPLRFSELSETALCG